MLFDQEKNHLRGKTILEIQERPCYGKNAILQPGAWILAGTWQSAPRRLDSSLLVSLCLIVPQRVKFGLKVFCVPLQLWDSLDRIHKEVCPLLNFFLHVLVCVYIFNSLKHTLNRLISW